MNKKLLVMILGITLSLSACIGKDQVVQKKDNNTDVKVEEQKAQDSQKQTTTTTITDENAVESTDVNSGMIKEEAYDNFLKKYPNAKVDSLSFKIENGTPVFEVEGYDDMNEYELKYNASNKKEIREKQDKSNNNKNIFISREQLQKVDIFVDRAKKDFGKNIKTYEYTFDFDDDRLVVNVEIKDNSNKEIEYKYDFESEKLIEKDM